MAIVAAFGDKKGLFLKALDLYVGDIEELKSFMDQSGSAQEAVHETLKAAVIRFTGNDTPKGCLLASATVSCSPESSGVQAAATKKRAMIEQVIRKRIERDVRLKILPEISSASALAAMTITLIQGLSVLARDGASRKKLFSVVELNMLVWSNLY